MRTCGWGGGATPPHQDQGAPSVATSRVRAYGDRCEPRRDCERGHSGFFLTHGLHGLVLGLGLTPGRDHRMNFRFPREPLGVALHAGSRPRPVPLGLLSALPEEQPLAMWLLTNVWRRLEQSPTRKAYPCTAVCLSVVHTGPGRRLPEGCSRKRR